MITYTDPQGSPEWHEARRGVITASRFKVCREKRGALSKAALLYAMDTARERCGGKPAETYQNAAMRFGTEQEPVARRAYEEKTGSLVYGSGFICTFDGDFGCSVDGLVDDDGMVEIKTIVSSDVLFTAVIDGDVSAYLDQIFGCLWLTGRKWCDLILWAPDLPESARMTVIRIKRDEDIIESLEADLLAFNSLVNEYKSKLSRRVAEAVA